MRVLIKPRSVARLAAVATVVLSFAPAAAGAPKYDLCDGHKWSLFGCRHDPARSAIGLPDAEHLPQTES